MSKLNTLLKQLKTDYPKLNFEENERFTFHPPNTIYYNAEIERPDLQLLHELGHFLNNDSDYTSDIALLRIESNAWATAKKLAPNYKIKWDEDFIQARLDSYRDWLHNASLCSVCQINGYQSGPFYHCPLCGKKWARQEIED